MKVIFLDRDGIINIDNGYVYKIKNFQFMDNIFEICRYFQKKNYELIICTNQSGIGRGYFSANQYNSLKKWMLDQFNYQGVKILDVLHCPHLPDHKCKCRKPLPGMLLSAQMKYNINMDSSYMIGDKETDILAGRAAGLKANILLRKNTGIDGETTKADYVIQTMKECTKYVS